MSRAVALALLLHGGSVAALAGGGARHCGTAGAARMRSHHAVCAAAKATPDLLLADAEPTADVSEGRPVIQWYPGHIAKAERLMSEVLSMVDVVVELRDSRVPISTTHPSLPGWIGSRGHVLVLNRIDSVPERASAEWERALLAENAALRPQLVDAKRGKGVAELKRAIIQAGQKVNDRRKRRGINPRPVRAAILGYPNVGKSALINRLVGRTKTKSENRPGVTRGFTWVRIDPQVQLLDSPGIIPAKAVEQAAAYHLAMCDDIGNAAYDTRGVAAALVERLALVARHRPTFARTDVLKERWGVPLDGACGEDYLQALADSRFTGDIERAATTVLKDFRTGLLGPMCIEWPE
jgi:ribosome biogenesis GTP-binding protein YlqF